MAILLFAVATWCLGGDLLALRINCFFASPLDPSSCASGHTSLCMQRRRAIWLDTGGILGCWGVAMWSEQDVLTHDAAVLRQEGFDAWYRQQVQRFKTRHRHQRFLYSGFAQRTNRATGPLQDPADLLSYNVLYAARHFAQFTALLNQLPTDMVRKPLDLKVFDYGCGQGLGSLALLEHLAGCSGAVELHLVEPSPLSLAAAQAQVLAQVERTGLQGVVHTHACALDALPDDLFVLRDGQQAVHVFSNVLDIAAQGCFDLDVLLAQIGQMRGIQLCLAVSPNHWSGKAGFDQLRAAFADIKPLVDTDALHSCAEIFHTWWGWQIQETLGRALALHVEVHDQ